MTPPRASLATLMAAMAAISSACDAGDIASNDASDAAIAADAGDVFTGFETRETTPEDASAPEDATPEDTTRQDTIDPDTTSHDTAETSPSDDDILGDTDSAGDTAAPPDTTPVEGPAHYAADRTHSPITPAVARALRDIAARDPALSDDVFMKVGDSITVSSYYLYCFSSANIDLADHAALADTLDFFLGGAAGDTDPFDRDSESALGGRTASWAMTGDPAPLDLELAAIAPRFAVVMFGTNDIGYWPEDWPRMFRWYADAYLRLVDRLTGAGVIPILMSIPPRDNDADLDAWVPTMNLLVRGIAEARQLPFVDYHRELLPLPGHGLAPDGVHPNAYSQGACHFSAPALLKGYNVRNLLTLEALDRVRRVVVDAEPAPDPPEPRRLTGAGTLADPLIVPGLPFTHAADTAASSASALDVYPDCGTGQDESGPEWVYRLDLARTTPLRAMVLDVGSVDIDLHILPAGATAGPDGAASACLARNDTLIEGTLPAGGHLLVLDTFVSAGTPRSGPYQLIVLECDPADERCATQL